MLGTDYYRANAGNHITGYQGLRLLIQQDEVAWSVARGVASNHSATATLEEGTIGDFFVYLHLFAEQ
mgnify:CR=1 FL=1